MDRRVGSHANREQEMRWIVRTVYLGDARVPFPHCGDDVWTWERDGDARYPIPDVGHVGTIKVECGNAYRKYHATVVGYGTLKTQAGGNDRAVMWELGDETEQNR